MALASFTAFATVLKTNTSSLQIQHKQVNVSSFNLWQF